MGPTATPSTVLADRYTVLEALRTTEYVAVYRAVDSQDGAEVHVHVLAAEIAGALPGGHVFDQALARAAELAGPHIAAPLDTGRHGEQWFWVTRPAAGHTVRELLARKAATGSAGFGARVAARILGTVADALARAHDAGVCHGCLGADSVVVSDDGDVAIVDFGLGEVLAASTRPGAPPRAMAPEIPATGTSTPAADVYSLGQLGYLLLVGRELAKGGPRPSDVAAGVPAAIDELIARSVMPDPGRRPAGAAPFRALFDRAMQAAAEASSPAIDIPVDGPSLAESLDPSSPALDPGLLAGTEEKWLVSKGRLDYGPFSTAELAEQIRVGEVVPGNVIIDNHNGERCAIEAHPLFHDAVEHARQLRDDNRRAQAEAAHAQVEKRRGVMLYAIIAGGVVVLGLVALLIIRAAGDDSDEVAAQSLRADGEADFSAALRFPKTKTAPDRPRPNRSGTARRPRHTGSDDTLALDLGDDSGGSERLDDTVINGVVQKHGNRLGRCLARNGGGHARIEFIIKGPTGKVSWVKVNGQQSGGLYGCVNKAMRAMKFPPVDGPRTRAEFEMEI